MDDCLYTYGGETIYKLDKRTGEVLARGKMDHKSSFAINSPTYAEGMIFVGLANGCVQAFDAVTLESLWLYEDPLGGQPNCPITYEDGYLYTGFWNREDGNANFVCLTVTDEDPAKTDESKLASWTYTSRGGFYWAGACVQNGVLLVGTDDGQNLTSPVLSTGRVLLFCIKAFLLLIGAVLGLVVLGLVVGLVTMLIGGAAVGFPFALAGGSLLIPVLIVLGIVLPLGIVVYLLLKLVFNLRSRRTTLSVLFGIWVLILIFLGLYLVKNYERIEEAFDRGDVEWYFNKTSGWHGAGVPDGIPIRHDTVRVETVTLGDSTLRDTVRIEYYTE